jgi:hypothetical protein
MWIVKKAWKIFSIITESFHIARDSWFHHLPHAHHKQASYDRVDHAYAHYAFQFCRSHENLHSYPDPLILCKSVNLHFVRYWGLQRTVLVLIIDCKIMTQLFCPVWKRGDKLGVGLQYKNVRPDYLKNIWKVVNWRDVAKRYDSA